jgi:hypothetical protein
VNTGIKKDCIIPLACGSLVYTNQQFVDHMFGRHNDVYLEHLTQACLQIRASQLEPGQSENFEIDLFRFNMFGHSHLVPIEQISLFCPAKFCIRNASDTYPVRIPLEENKGIPSCSLRVFIKNKNGRLFLVTAYWFNPDTKMDRANPKFWARHGVIYRPYFYGQPFTSTLKDIFN